jgi:amino acid transporter
MQARTGKDCENGAMMGRIGYRPYWVFSLSILIRALHQVGAAVFLAAYLLDAIPAPPSEYVTIAVLTGVLLFASEWLRHRQIHREFSGVITLVKLLFLGAAYHGFLPMQGAVLLAFILASVGAHAPKQLRHRLLF